MTAKINPYHYFILMLIAVRITLGPISGGRHFVDIIGVISWTKGVTSRGHFWRHLVDENVHEMSSFWVTFRGHFLGDFSWTFIKQSTNPNLTLIQTPTQPNPNLT